MAARKLCLPSQPSHAGNGGTNESEDSDRPFFAGHVQVTTIHQAKGLEFPVAVVGSLSAPLSHPETDIDRDLGGSIADVRPHR